MKMCSQSNRPALIYSWTQFPSSVEGATFNGKEKEENGKRREEKVKRKKSRDKKENF